MKRLRSYIASNIDLQPRYLYLIRPNRWLDIPHQGLSLVGNPGFSLNNEALTRSFIRESLTFYSRRRQDGDFVKSYSHFCSIVHSICANSKDHYHFKYVSYCYVFVCGPFYNNFSYFIRSKSRKR